MGLALAVAGCQPVTEDTLPLPCVAEDGPASWRCGLRHALEFLEATQVREDRREGSPVRLRGEWPSTLRWLPARAHRGNVVEDSNAFVPLSVVFPLSLLDDTGLPPPARRLGRVREEVLRLVASRYADGAGEVNFWPTVDGFHGPPQLAREMPFLALGARGVFDIANDADDTALFHGMVAALPVEAAAAGVPVQAGFPALLEAWRDHGDRALEHASESWKPRGTGAFLTWLAEERDPRGRVPLWPTLPNTVDCVVMVNALWALGRVGSGNVAGHGETCRLARRVMAEGTFPRCSHYYPGRWVFPYAVARAWVDGGNGCLAQREEGSWPLGAMVAAVLDGQRGDGGWEDDTEPASWAAADQPGFRGTGRVFATALATNALLLALRGGGWEPDTGARAAAAAERGARYLVHHASHEQTDGYHWRGGVFFSSSFGAVALWKSPAVTTGLVLEALTRQLQATRGGGGGPLTLTAGEVPPAWLADPW
jgi:hypothetical protein